MVTQEVKFDLLNQKQDKPILCRYGEDGRTIYGTIINSDDEDHTVNLNNFTGIKIQMYKPDGNFVIKDATVSSGHVVIPIDEQMTACAGTGFMDLKLTAIDGTIYTCHATVIIDTPVATDDTIESLSIVNGYVFPDDFQLKLTAGEAIYFTGEDNRTINARATSLVEGTGIDITGNTISVDSEVLSKVAEVDGKQDTLTAGAGISITNDTISATVEGLNVITGEQTSDGYGNIIIDLSSHTDVLPESVVSIVAYMEQYNVYEPLCIGFHTYPINGVNSVVAKFVTAFSLNPCSNTSIKYRLFYKPIILVAEEKHVGEGE